MGTVFANASSDLFLRPDNSGNSHIPGVLAGLLIPQAVCTVFILARLWSRLFLLHKWFYDDTLIVSAWLFSTAVCVLYTIAAQTPNIRDAVLNSGAGTGNSTADPPITSTYSLTTYLALIFYQLALLLTKLSILSFYLRVFSSRPIERRLAVVTILLVILYGIPLLALSIFQCRPASSTSFFPLEIPKCFPFTPLLIASSSLHTVTDAWLILLIAPCVARLAIPRGQKLALAAVLSLGVFVIAASLTRLQLSLRAGYGPAGTGTTGGGVRVASTLMFFVMTVLECDVALLCACAPMLRPLLARLWPALGLGEAGGENVRRVSRRLRRRRLSRRRGAEGDEGGEDEEEEDSVNLTVVSYHGYPWVRDGAAGSAARSKNVSAANVAAEMAIPVPPRPATLRTPTTLSLRSFMSGIAPRSRGQTVSTREDREVLLGDEGERKRRSSVGFEGYYDQYLGYGEEKRRSGARNSLAAGPGAWSNSQESFVLGVNDPASPTRLSPVSNFSGTAFAGVGDGHAKIASQHGETQRR